MLGYIEIVPIENKFSSLFQGKERQRQKVCRQIKKFYSLTQRSVSHREVWRWRSLKATIFC